MCYDDLYAYFIRQTKVTKNDVPSTIEGQVNLIHDGIIEFNVRLRIAKDKLKYDDELEQLSEELDSGELLFLSECMSLIIYKNMRSEFVSTWETFQSDIGRKYYNNQLSGREKLIEDQETRLDHLKFALYSDFDEGL